MTQNEQEQLTRLLHPLDDALRFQIEVIEVYAKKIDPKLRFEILNACRGLREIQRQALGVVSGLISNAETGELEQALRVKKEKRLSVLQGKMEAFELLADAIKQHIQITDDQIQQKEALTKRNRPGKGKKGS